MFGPLVCPPCSEVKSPTLRPQQTATNAAQLPATLPALGPGGAGHGRASRPCNPVSARRARGLTNASESHKSRLCRLARGGTRVQESMYKLSDGSSEDSSGDEWVPVKRVTRTPHRA
eukprot:scaffold54378_cov62-Phaeocystis_antarctica.AAC.2